MNTKHQENPSFIRGNVQGNRTCETLAIHTHKVFDAAIIDFQNKTFSVNVDGAPADAVYKSCKPTTTTAIVRNVSITPLADRPNFARVVATAALPVEISYDNHGIEEQGYGVVTEDFDLILCIPKSGIVPVDIHVQENLVAISGKSDGPGVFSITVCMDMIVTVECDAVLLMPSYGYAYIPKGQWFCQNPCSAFQKTPLYPSPHDKC